jgi:exodeoxyribonuclease VII large subunit
VARTFSSISRVQARLRKLLEPALSAKPFWVKAELSGVDLRKGRLYCDLVELKDGEVVAKMRCTAWGRELSNIQTRLQHAKLEGLLADGNEVGLACRVQYHALYGMSIQAVDIDPNESLGALERKRQELLAKLVAEGLLHRNAEHVVPAVPMRIGLVASRETAGYRDFVATLLDSGYAFRILAADARVEGDAPESSVLRALDRLSRLDVDLVVVLRGGGSRLSLSYLDNEAIARAIANFPHPVWTAIGHEIDTSVLDEVAGQSFKTPTAVAEELLARHEDAHAELEAAALAIRNAARMRLGPERARLTDARRSLRSGALRMLREEGRSRVSAGSTFKLMVERRLTGEFSRLVRARGALASAAKARVLVSDRVLLEHRKSLYKTVGRRLKQLRGDWDERAEWLTSPARLQRIESARARHRDWGQILRAADPARNLERGYALVSSGGALIRSISELSPGAAIQVSLVDGVAATVVKSISSAADGASGKVVPQSKEQESR